MDARKNRSKRIKVMDGDYVADFDQTSIFSHNDLDDHEAARKSRIRDSNKEFARRMTILQSWSEYWDDYTTRDGDAYPQQEARSIIKKAKKIACPITSCGKTFTSIGGLKYHYARCNIERSFKCKVCDPPIQFTTRGELLRHLILTHYDELPALNDDQKEIVNSYLSFENRGDKLKKDRKISVDSEAPCSSQNLVKAFKQLRSRVYASEDFVSCPFKDWRSTIKDWELISYELDRRRFYPPETESAQFQSDSDESKWRALATGESLVLNKDKKDTPTSTIFYTGGINTAAAWLPKSLYDKHSDISSDLIAIAVSCCSMDKSHSYKESTTGEGCIQFWTTGKLRSDDEAKQAGADIVVSNNSNVTKIAEEKVSLNYLIGHNYGTIFDMVWCPLGTSWQPQVDTGEVLSRVGLLALACGDGQVRIFNVPHTQSLLSRASAKMTENIVEATPIFKPKPIALLKAPGVGPSTDYQTAACKTICWDSENQRLIAAGYANGYVALFDLANISPILYTSIDGCHVYQPLKSWIAHGAPVTGVAISSTLRSRYLVATGSTDRQLKIWDPMDLNSCLMTDRAPITKILWDFRFRGVVTATDTAFTSFNNRVSYRYPAVDGSHNVTVSVHRSTVWGLANSIITNALATSDAAGEVFVIPQLITRSSHKRDRNHLITHSLFTMIPQALNDVESGTVIRYAPAAATVTTEGEVDAATTANDTPDLNNETQEQPILDKELLPKGEPDDSLNEYEIGADFSIGERPLANKPTKFLLPIEHRPIEIYSDFKSKFGLKFQHYNLTAIKPNSKIPESCLRAGDTQNIYCDRPCDYPFSSINIVAWSPNLNTFPYLLSAMQVGFCRIDKVQIVDQIFRGYVDSIKNS